MNIGKINFVDTDIKFRQIQQSKNITQVKHEKKDDKNRNNNINFTSRSATIRFADDIARKVNQEFPRISSSKIDDFKSFKKHKDIYVNFEKLLWKKVNSARKETMKTNDR